MSCTADTSSSLPQRIALRGIEPLSVAVEDAGYKCAFPYLISGDMDQMLQHLPTAVMRVFNRHPRMRALLLKDDTFTAEIQPSLTLDDVATKQLLRVREFSESSEDVDKWTNWGAFAEEECHVPYERFTQFMFYLTVWVNKSSKQARVFIFADHVVSDGDTGMVVMNDILEDIALLSIEAAKPVKELPLRPSLYSMWFDPSPMWLKPVAKTILALFGRSAFIKATSSVKPLLPPRSDQHDFTVPIIQQNSTSGLFADGDPACMRSTLGRCKEEGVTFGGAMIAIALLAYYHTSEHKSTEDPFKLALDVCFNMRQRVPEPAEERQVGMYAILNTLQWLMKEGVDLRTSKFWDVARRCKQEMTEQSENLLGMALPVFMADRKFHPKALEAFMKDHRIASSVRGDVTVSNIGRYPYKPKHILAANGTLEIESLHTMSTVPFLGNTSVMWVMSLNAFHYSIGYKCEHSVGKDLFKAYVTICENAGSIGPNDTMLDVLAKLKLYEIC